jgi:hypothetical protein
MSPPSLGLKSKPKNKHEAGDKPFACWFLGIFFRPDDGGDIFLRNVG